MTPQALRDQMDDLRKRITQAKSEADIFWDEYESLEEEAEEAREKSDIRAKMAEELEAELARLEALDPDDRDDAELLRRFELQTAFNHPGQQKLALEV